MITDILRTQYDIFGGLLSCSLFNNLNLVLEREFLAQGEIDYSTIWLSPRNGCSGAGLMVEVPTLQLPRPNSLQRNLIFSVVIIEERNINLTAGTGTGKTAEEWGELALDFLYSWLLGSTSGLTPETTALRRAREYVENMAMRASVSLRQEHRPLPRPSTVTITADDDLNVTLSVTDGSTIWYTTDGFSFPGPGNVGGAVLPNCQAATQYGAPFNVASGAVIRAAAWQPGLIPGHIAAATVT